MCFRNSKFKANCYTESGGSCLNPQERSFIQENYLRFRYNDLVEFFNREESFDAKDYIKLCPALLAYEQLYVSKWIFKTKNCEGNDRNSQINKLRNSICENF